MIRNIISWNASFCMLLLSSHSTLLYAQATENSSSQTYRKALQQIEQYMASITELRAHLDRSQIDSAALLDRLEYDSDQIIEYVQNEIYFEQYAGSLRGVEGTIRSTAGNALDQATLLAKLLKDAGFEARIAQGILTPLQAERLLAAMAVGRSDQSPYADKEAFYSALRKMWALSGQSEQAFASTTARFDNPALASNSELNRITLQETDFILNQLRANGISLGDPNSFSRLIEEARDYYWVEYRVEAGATWNSAHPAVGRTDLDFSSTQPERTFAESIPVELQHRFRFEVFLETEVNGKQRVRPLLKPWERPTANLIDEPLSFTIVPFSFASQMEQDKIEIPEGRNEIFIPLFLGQFAETTFDLMGNMVPLEAAASNYAAIFATDAEKMSRAATGLNALGSKAADSNQPVIALTAVKLKFVFVEPGGVESEYWRTVYLRSDSAGKHESARIMHMLSELTANYSFLVATGSSNAAASLDTSLATIGSKRSLLDTSLARLFGLKEVKSSGSKKNSNTTWIGLAPTYAIFDSYETRTGFQTYRHRPSLLVYKSTVPLRGIASVSTDVVQNRRRVRSVDGINSPSALKSMISVGVWESVTEDSLLTASAMLRKDTHSIFEQYREENLKFQVLKPEDTRLVADLDISDYTKIVLSRDLERRFTIILPANRALPEIENLFWWRVDTQTGETLGISATGAGAGEAAEYTTLQRLVAGSVVGNLVGITCDATRRNVARDTSLTSSDCIILGIGAGIGTAMGASPIDGVPTGLVIAIALLVLQKYIAPLTDT